MDENLIKRIGDEYLQANHKDGETFLHTDYNEFLSIFKTSINENYYDIQRIIKGTLKVYNTTKLDGATLSRSVNGSLSSDDNTIPSSKQVKSYVDNYYNELSKKDEALSTTVSGAVSASNIAIDTANSAAFDASNALDIATQASTQASRADFNADTAMNTATELSRTKADVTEMEKRALITETGNKLSFSVDPSTYVLTIKLLDKLNNVLSTGTVDLPIESLVMNVSYDAETKSITLTLQNGEKVSFSVSTLVEGLVSEDTFNQRIEQLKKDLRTELTQTITDDANSSFNQNVKNKTDSFNENSSLKTNEFNNNATQKTLDYNNNCISKTNSFNQNSTQKLTEFNDNYTSKLNSFNSNADLRMDEYNANADNKIAEYDLHSQELDNKIIATRNELERVKNDVLETGTDTDTFVHLEDSAMAEYQELSVDGVCEQETTSGKNLFNVSKLDVDMRYQCTTNISDGKITITSNASTGVSFCILKPDLKLKPNTTYSISFDFEGSINQMRLYDVTANEYINISQSGTSRRIGKFTTNDNTDYRLAIYVILNQSMTVSKIQVEEGTVATNYEPYTGGQPSPNPDYPQEIKTIENSLIVTSCNKNLFKMNDNYSKGYKTTKNGITLKVEDDLSISLKGTATAKTEFFLLGSWGAKNNSYIQKGIFTISQNGFIDGITSNLGFFKNGVNVQNKGLTYTNTTVTFNSSIIDFDGMSYAISIADGKTIDTQVYTQIENDKKATSYIQHIQSQITANLPEGELIGKINDTYKDTLKVEYNEEDGQYHLVLNANIGKVVLDGSERWTTFNNLTPNYSYFATKKYDSIIGFNTFIEYSTHFSQTNSKITPYYITDKPVISGTDLNENFRIRILISSSVANNIETFKTWLSTHNTEVYYVLANPYTIDLGVVDMPLSYDEITNIFTDSDLLPKINAKYYRNFITTISNLQVNEKALKQELIDINTRLSALENAQTSTASESEVVE